MADFSHLQALAASEDTTAEYKFNWIVGEPSIILAPAHDVNKPYRIARIEMSLKVADELMKPGARAIAKEKLTAESVIANEEEEREHNRVLISRYCARSWGTSFLDAKGKSVPFTADNCYDLFKALSIERFDDVARFASNLYNFYPEQKLPLTEDAGDSLGNS